MPDEKDKAGRPPAKNSRQDRLKLALRENLKRRKSQAKGRSGDTPPDDAGSSLHDISENNPDE